MQVDLWFRVTSNVAGTSKATLKESIISTWLVRASADELTGIFWWYVIFRRLKFGSSRSCKFPGDSTMRIRRGWKWNVNMHVHSESFWNKPWKALRHIFDDGWFFKVCWNSAKTTWWTCWVSGLCMSSKVGCPYFPTKRFVQWPQWWYSSFQSASSWIKKEHSNEQSRRIKVVKWTHCAGSSFSKSLFGFLGHCLTSWCLDLGFKKFTFVR